MSESETTNELHNLTPELWAMILSHLLPDQENDFERTEPYVCVHHAFKHQQFMFGQDGFPAYGDNKDSYNNPCIYGFAKYQAFLRQLPLVCKQFAAVFRDHPQLSQSLTIGETTGAESPDRESLLEWVQQNGKSVRMLSVASSDYSPNSEVFRSVVDALATSSAVTSVLMENCHTMSEIALLTSVQTLALEGPEDTVDLDPLQALHGLQTLYLAGGFTPFHQGRYSCTALPSHLTSLCLYGTELFVETRDSHDAKLKKLGLFDSRLIVEHDEPMIAYVGLEELHLHQSNYYTHDPEHDDRPEFTAYNYDSPFCFWFPADFSALKCLRVLDIRSKAGYNRVSGGARWALHGFPCLQDLTLGSVEMPLVIDEAFAELTGLTRLSLNAGDVLHSGSESDTQRIELDMPWQAMPALQEVTICGSLVFNKGLYDLLELEALKHFRLDLHWHEDNVDEAAALFLPLTASFAARPQVNFVITHHKPHGLPVDNADT